MKFSPTPENIGGFCPILPKKMGDYCQGGGFRSVTYMVAIERLVTRRLSQFIACGAELPCDIWCVTQILIVLSIQDNICCKMIENL